MTELSDRQMRLPDSGPAATSSDKLTIVFMVLSGITLFLSLLIFVSAVYYDAERQEVIDKRTIGNLEVKQLRVEQQQRLEEYGWIDQASGVVGIPVERAIQLLTGAVNGNGQDQTVESQEEAVNSPQ